MFQKPKRFKSDEYLKFIRRQYCYVCAARKADPHHLKSVGSGGSDLTCIPLCRKHHTEVHMSRVKFEEKHNINLKEAQMDYLQKFIEEKMP